METKQLYEKVGNEFKPINPSVSLDELVDKESDLTLGEILVKYNHLKLNWKGNVDDTRREVPIKYRRQGLYITYNNGSDLITEYYVGDNNVTSTEAWTNNNNWKTPITEDWINANISKLKPAKDSVGYEQLTPNLRQLINQNTNVTNYPDDEDLTSQDNLLKLKDREYNPDEFSGKGYVILRKNLKKINGVVKNVLEQSMVNKKNTIYEVRYDFDLNGETLIIGEYSTLKFCGGCLRNGGLNLWHRNIQASKTSHIFKDVTVFGITIYPEWFGAKGDGATDDSDVFNYIGNLYVNIELLPRKTYILGKEVKIILSTSSFLIPNSTTIKASDDFSGSYLLKFRGRNPYNLFGNKIYGNGIIDGNNKANIGVSVAGSINTLISDIQIKDCLKNGLRCRLDDKSEGYGYDGSVIVKNIRVYNDSIKGDSSAIAMNLPDSYLDSCVVKGYSSGVSAISSCTINNLHVWDSDTFAICYGSPVFNNAYSDGCKLIFDLVMSGNVNCNGLYWYNNSDSENEMSLADIHEKIWSILQVSNIYEQPTNAYNLVKTKNLAKQLSLFIDQEKSTALRNYDYPVNVSTQEVFFRKKIYNIYRWDKEGIYYVTSFTNQIIEEFGFWNIVEGSQMIVKIKCLVDKTCIQNITLINPDGNFSNIKRITKNGIILGFLDITTSSESIIKNSWYLRGSTYIDRNNNIPYIFLNGKKRILYTDNFDWKGTSDNRPQLDSNNEGFEYYDSTLKKKILWNGSDWVNMDGTVLS